MNVRKYFLIISIITCFCMFCAFDENSQKIYDDANLLTDTQEQELQERCVKLSLQYKTEFIIATTENTGGISTESYVKNFCFRNDFGYEENTVDKSCVVYLIDMDNREVYMLLSGLANYYFEDEMDQITDTSLTYLQSADYYGACEQFLDDCETDGVDAYNKFQTEYLELWENYDGNYDSFYQEYLYESIFSNIFVDLGIAAGVSLIVILIMRGFNKSKMVVNQSTYMDKSSYDMRRKNDIYIRTTTTKHKRDSGGSSGGGGGGGGRSFSGCGKSF